MPSKRLPEIMEEFHELQQLKGSMDDEKYIRSMKSLLAELRVLFKNPKIDKKEYAQVLKLIGAINQD